jgi:hypothetical protein
MANTLKRISGPAYIANAAADIYTPPAATIYTVIRHIHIANKSGAAVTFSLYVGGTAGSAGGTELFKDVSIPAAGSSGCYFDHYFSPGLKMLSTDFLSGVASAASALVITVMGEQGVV